MNTPPNHNNILDAPDETARDVQPTPVAKPRNRLAISAAALALTGVLGGLVGVAAATEGSTTTTPAAAPQRQVINIETNTDGAETGPDLGSVTLGELADELDRLGLELTIDPADSDPTDNNDAADGDPTDNASQDDDKKSDGDRDGQDFVDPFGDGHSHGQEEEPAASFNVDGDRLDTSGVSPELAEQATKIWNRFTTLMPADQRQMVSGFELMSAGYDGAHVYPTEADPTKWVLGMGADPGEDLDYVLIHEFGHLLTLQAKEVPPSDNSDSCTTYYTGEGCALSGSTFAEFVQKFWPKEMLDQVNELYENEDYDGLDEFYEQNKDRFVTDYAATNPGEDLAETVAHFVTEDRPTGDTIADQKVNLLWADPDMVALRAQIRANL